MFSSWRPRSRNDLFTKSFQKLVFLAVIVSCTACAQTGVRPVAQTAEKSLPLPMRILIFGVTADESEVAEYQGIMRQHPAQRDALERRREIANNVSQVSRERRTKQYVTSRFLRSAGLDQWQPSEPTALRFLDRSC